jgi:AraC-like DNA-binding protein
MIFSLSRRVWDPDKANLIALTLDDSIDKVANLVAIVQIWLVENMRTKEAERLPFDPLSDVLALLKPESYGVRGLDAGGAWSISYPALEGMKCYAIEEGACWLALDGMPAPVQLHAGDCILLPGGTPFKFFSEPGVPSVDAVELFSSVPPGRVVTFNGGGGGGACRGLGGYFLFSGLHSALLLSALPPLVQLTNAADQKSLRWYLESLMQELADPQPGSALMVEHLVQSLLIRALRLHANDVHASEGKGSVGWLYALRDRKIGSAIGAMHQDPGRKWTVESLAAVAGMSRSGFSARFHELVGEPTMEYLTKWRMHLAADRIANRQTPVAVLADLLGYESESAFGAAFKRVMGKSPRQFAAVHRSALLLQAE